VRGLSGVVTRGELRYRTAGRSVAYDPTTLDLELLAAVDAAASRNLPLAVVLPLLGARLPVLIGAAALINAITGRGRLDAHVAVVSGALAHRSLYDSLYLRDSRLADLVPRASINAAGELRPVGVPLRAANGALTFVSDSGRLAALLETGVPIDGLVCDSAIPPTELGRLLDAHVDGPFVYLASAPADSGIMEVRSRGGLVWAFDAPAVSALAAISVGGGEPLIATAETLAAAAAAPLIVRAPAGPAPLDEALAGTWRALSAAGRTCGSGLAEALHWAFGVFSVAAATPVSPALYDRFAAPNPYALRLSDSPGHARAVARVASGACAGMWLDLATAFEELLAAAAPAPKMGEVVAWVADVVAEGVPAAIVAKSATAAAALSTALAEHPQVPLEADAMVAVETLRNLATGRRGARTGRLLLPGPLPRAAAGLLAMPPAEELTVLAAGPWEAARITRQVLSVRAELAELRVLTHASSAELMTSAAAGGPAQAEPVLIVEGTAAPLPPDDGINVFEPFGLDVLAELRGVLAYGLGDDHFLPPARDEGTVVAALRLDFADGVLFASPYDLLDIRDGSEIRRVAAKALHPGNDLVLVSSSARRALFDAITDTLAELPEYAPVAERLRFWRSRVRRVAGIGMSYQQVLDAMAGTSLTSSSTIYSWYRGENEGPADLDDVERFGRALADTELMAAAPHVASALATMRRIHRKIGRWLSSQLTAVHGGREDSLVDNDLSIHVSDLLEVVTVHRVLAIEVELMGVPAARCGVLLPKASAAAYRPTGSSDAADELAPPDHESGLSARGGGA